MCIKSNFEKINELQKKCHRNKIKIGILQDQIKLLETESAKNPFSFLQNSNNIDLCNKKKKQLSNENHDIDNEIKEIPKQIKKELCDSINNYFINKHNKLQFEADLAIERVRNDIRRKNVLKKINITGCSLLLLISIYVIRKKVL